MRGGYKAAKSIGIRAMRTRERIEGRKDLCTLASISIVALVLQYQGKYEAADEVNQ